MKILNDLFILEGMKDSIILAGHRGLTRHVQYVNISDTPDVINYLDKNYLLLTTAYPFKDDPDQLCELIKEMHALDCAGIVIKVNRFLKELPEKVKILADNLAFPIIDLPESYALGDLSRHILNYLNDHEAELLYYALHVHKDFSNMMFKGYSLKSLVEQLGHFLSRPAILVNHRGETLAYSHDFRKDSMKITMSESLDYIQQHLQDARNGITFEIPSFDHRSISTFPVETKREYSSMLVIFDVLTLPYPSSQMAIEQAANVISFTIIKEQAIEENSRLLKNNFFADLIEQRIDSEKEIVSRANYYGLKEHTKTICIACIVDAHGENYDALQFYEKKVSELHHTIYDQLEDEIAHNKANAILFTKEMYFVILLQYNHQHEIETEHLQPLIEKAKKNIEGDFTVSFGISNPILTLSDIPIAYEEAVEAIQNGYELKQTSFINFYKAREIEDLLNTIPQKDSIAFYENTLKNLAYPATKEDQELVKTIKVYLDCQCNISETSRKLYVHRNTVKYRVQKTENLLKRNFQDPDDSLRIRVALVLGSFLTNQE